MPGAIPYYYAVRHPAQIAVQHCYLCHEPLGSVTSKDHIIPQTIFETGSGYRPHLYTHDACNKRKSMDDEWFKRMVDMICAATSDDANSAALRFFRKARDESENAFMIGAADKIRTYRLARKLIDASRPRPLQPTLDGRRVPQMSLNSENSKRFSTYIASMCYGLFVRNVAAAQPSLPEVSWIQYAQIEITGEGADVHADAMDLIRSSQADGTGFCQRWGHRVKYAGSPLPDDPGKGFVYVDLFSSMGILGVFR